MNLKEKLLQQFENSELFQNYCQMRIDKLYTIFWNTRCILAGFSPNKHSRKYTLEQLQMQLQKNKVWFLSYLSSCDWDKMKKLEQNRICDVMATYIACDTSLNTLEKLHLAKYYCNQSTDYYTMINKMALTEIATTSYLQNSLYENGKSSYVKK